MVAGVVLGSLSMRTRSIYAGFLVHGTVAILMDVLALYRRHFLPAALTPGSSVRVTFTHWRSLIWIAWAARARGARAQSMANNPRPTRFRASPGFVREVDSESSYFTSGAGAFISLPLSPLAASVFVDFVLFFVADLVDFLAGLSVEGVALPSWATTCDSILMFGRRGEGRAGGQREHRNSEQRGANHFHSPGWVGLD